MANRTPRTKEELQKEKEKLQSEISRLEKIIEASSKTTFEIIIEDLKVRMAENVKMEQWSALKNNIKEVDSIKGTQNFIETQSTLLEKKQEELQEVEDSLQNYQTSLFDNQPAEEVTQEKTGFNFKDVPIETGDIFANEDKTEYLLVKRSEEIEGSFAIVSNYFTGERCLQYPSNFALLNDKERVGNIYYMNNEPIKSALKIISDYQDSLTDAKPLEVEEVEDCSC